MSKMTDIESMASKYPRELVERAEALESPEEVLALAQEEGIELTDEELEAVSGGLWFGRKPKEYGSGNALEGHKGGNIRCEFCGGALEKLRPSGWYRCTQCGRTFSHMDD